MRLDSGQRRIFESIGRRADSGPALPRMFLRAVTHPYGPLNNLDSGLDTRRPCLSCSIRELEEGRGLGRKTGPRSRSEGSSPRCRCRGHRQITSLCVDDAY